MQRALIAAGFIMVIAVAAWFVLDSGEPDRATSEPSGSTPVAPAPSGGTASTREEPQTKRRPGLEGPEKVETPDTPIPPEKRAKAVYTPDPDDDRALVGLGFTGATDAERERLKVPDRFGKGVIITSIHPDAPAAEAGLAKEDVIVRAHRTAVSSTDDLINAVGDRSHTVLTVSRDGRLFNVVLHKPFVPKAAAN